MTAARLAVEAAIKHVGAGTPFADLDSLDRVELVMWLEARLGISLPDDAAEGTVAELVRAVEEALKP